MESKEVNKELAMSYDELVNYLLKKYGPAKYNYFSDLINNVKERRVTRTKEGLICHHIDEDKAVMLSNHAHAIMNPPEYQEASRLVYCNILEHLILHIKIVEGPRNKLANKYSCLGLGGVINYICPQINDYYDGYIYKRQYQKNIFSKIKNNFDDYINVLKYFIDVIENKKPEHALLVTIEKLSEGWDSHVVEKVYDQLI